MRKKNILIIRGHPKSNSFCNALINEYIRGAKANEHKIKEIVLNELNLEEYLKYEHKSVPDLEEELLECQNLIKWSEHIVFSYPVWWATPPALLKVFIECVFTSGFAYKYKKPKGKIPNWDKYLTGKSSRIISTMDSPPLYYKLIVKDPGFKMMKATLNFCGIKPVKKNYFGSVKMSTEEKRKIWLKWAYNIGISEK